MGIKRATVGAVAAGALVVGLGACGSVADKAGEKAAEKLTEKAIEDQTGGSADVDISDGGVKIDDGQGGSFEVDADGNVSGSSGDGTYEVGEGTTLPEGWPADLEPPAGAEIVSAITSGDSMSVVANIDAPLREVYEAVKGQIEDAGYEVTNDTYSSSDGGDFASVSGTGDEFEVVVTLATDGVGGSGTVATMNLTTVAG
jgi:hypothetical protein